MSTPSPGFLCTTLLSLLLATAAQAENGIQSFKRILSTPDNSPCLTIDVEVPKTPPEMHITRLPDGRTQVKYPMVHNNIAEGWSWRENNQSAERDYYRFKYLPLGSETENRGEYSAEDKIGEPQTMQISWRYDYFFAFDNIYDFYPRNPEDDEAGFSAILEMPASGLLGLRADVCLESPTTSESTTFWKATHGKPVDFTLKKRYLIGKLRQLDFIDLQTGKILASSFPLNQ